MSARRRARKRRREPEPEPVVIHGAESLEDFGVDARVVLDPCAPWNGPHEVYEDWAAERMAAWAHSRQR